MKTILNLLFASSTLSIAYGLKIYFSQASVEGLFFILQPTATLVSLVSGISFKIAPDLGFVNPSHSLIIAPGCAGGNFMVIALLVIAWSGIGTLKTIRKKTLWLIISPFVAYIATIAVNSIRVILSIWLYRAPIYSGLITEGGVHRLTGVLVYLIGLILLKFSIERIISKYQEQTSRQTRLWQPIFCYILIVIIVPLLNHMGNPLPDLFMTHCFSVAFGCALVFTIFRLSGLNELFQTEKKPMRENCNIIPSTVKNTNTLTRSH